MSRLLSTRPVTFLLGVIFAASLAACAPAQTTPAQTVPTSAASAASASTGSTTPTEASTTMTKLNLNTVSGDELLTAIPGFGSRMVREFQEYRPYVSILQFRREIGKYVDDAQVAEYEKYVYVPIAINDADAATLQQIPGLDATEAEALMAGRPYASREAFLSALANYVSGSELTIAQTYLSGQ